jgi:hypothetical protein
VLSQSILDWEIADHVATDGDEVSGYEVLAV